MILKEYCREQIISTEKVFLYFAALLTLGIAGFTQIETLRGRETG
jgi:hypothetical protein